MPTCKLLQLDGVCLQRSVMQWHRSDISSVVYDHVMYILSYIPRMSMRLNELITRLQLRQLTCSLKLHCVPKNVQLYHSL